MYMEYFSSPFLHLFYTLCILLRRYWSGLAIEEMYLDFIDILVFSLT